MSDSQFIKISDKVKVFAFPFLVGVITFFLIKFFDGQDDIKTELKGIKAEMSSTRTDDRIRDIRIDNNVERINKHEERLNNYESIFVNNK